MIITSFQQLLEYNKSLDDELRSFYKGLLFSSNRCIIAYPNRCYIVQVDFFSLFSFFV